MVVKTKRPRISVFTPSHDTRFLEDAYKFRKLIEQGASSGVGARDAGIEAIAKVDAALDALDAAP